MENQVYCSKCKYYGNYVGRVGGECWHPTNLREDSTWFDVKQVPVSSPAELNRNNDCPNFDKDTNAQMVWNNKSR